MISRKKIILVTGLFLILSTQLLAASAMLQAIPLEFQHKDPKIALWEEIYANHQIKVMAFNKWQVPIEFKISSASGDVVTVVPAHNKAVVASFKADITKARQYSYHYFFGDPTVSLAKYKYALPFKKTMKTLVSQGFNGLISHNDDLNRYAVDVAMPQGTTIFVARDGTVLKVEKYQTKNHNFMKHHKLYNKGSSSGNFVDILHDDGTIANYHHLAPGSVKVAVGQKVKTGDYLAKSGNTGYSSGPHLHFMVLRNIGFKYISIPFEFDTYLKGLPQFN